MTVERSGKPRAPRTRPAAALKTAGAKTTSQTTSKTTSRSAPTSTSTATAGADAKLPVHSTGNVEGSADDFQRCVAGELTSVARLSAALAAHGTKAASARVGLARTLSTELLIHTSAPAERQAGALLKALGSGAAVEASQAVTQALARGPLAVAELVSALAWRIGAAAADGASGASVKKAGALLDAIVDAGVAALAARTPAEIRDAVAINVALSALLSRGQTLESSYLAPANLTYTHAFDAFTNERALPDATRALPQSGGATVGVSGGVLHLAAHTRAELAVVVDTNPEIRDYVLIMGTAAMVLTEQAARAGADDAALVDLIYQELLGPARGSPALIDKLRAAGLPEPLLARAPAVLKGLYAETGMNWKMVWLAPTGAKFPANPIAMGAGGDVAEVASNFRHLAALARRGALVAPVVDLSDKHAFARVGALLAHKAAPLRTLHLSNALDYVFDPRGVVQNLQVLPGAADATVTSCTAGQQSTDRRLGDWYKPGVNHMSAWTAQDGIAAALRLNGRALTDAAVRAGLPYDALRLKVGAGSDADALRAELEQAVAAHYADPKRAMRSLLGMLPSSFSSGGVADPTRRLAALGVSPPRDPAEAQALARALRQRLAEP